MSWLSYIADVLGTSRWVVALRLTDGLRAKGYTVAISQKRYREIRAQFAALQKVEQ